MLWMCRRRSLGDNVKRHSAVEVGSRARLARGFVSLKLREARANQYGGRGAPCRQIDRVKSVVDVTTGESRMCV